jgi:diguanylate cyclase (GGDEF)-like protein
VVPISLRIPAWGAIAERRLALLCEGLAAAALTTLIIGNGGGRQHITHPIAVSLASIALVAVAACFVRHLILVSRNKLLASEHIRLNQKAYSDPLTGLMNRVAFSQVLEGMRKTGATRELAILFFDLDRFKEVNDTLGHKIGDLLLIEVAGRLCARLTGATAIARMGGDEFATIIPLTAPRGPEECALDVIESLNEPFMIEGHVVTIGTSIGIAFGNLGSDHGEDLLQRADLAMYEAKGRATSGYRIFDDELTGKIAAKTGIRLELSKSIAEDLLALHFQPIVNARTGALESAEALLRWRSPTLGEIPPGVLIPIAEESGQIIELSNWTLDKALAAIKELGDVAIGVNISPIHFRHHSFATMIADKLLAAGVRPDLLHIEITEGVLISHMEIAKRAIAQLRNLGVKVFLDDFGTGYSSLSYLQSFDLDGMKIDKSFLRDIGERSQATQIMRSVINLGHSLNLQVVAEGIENDWQARLLQLLNCDLLQGFFIATPMPLGDLKLRREQNISYQEIVGTSEQHSKSWSAEIKAA